MTHFRFRYKLVGYMRWRCRAASRRVTLLMIQQVSAAQFAPSTAAWRRTMPTFAPVPKLQQILKIGDFVVGEEGDPQLVGHPDIRY
jgi:hypothetical protein